MTSAANTMRQPLSRLSRLDPDWTYVFIACLVYGAVASFTLIGPLSIWAPNRDLWQHLAVLGALIDDPHHPLNPFVHSHESSRSFGPFWVTLAYLARWTGLSAMQALQAAAVINLALLAYSIHAFARAALPGRWGPLALFAALSFGWVAPVMHTGYHSLPTLIEGAAYPAVTMIAGSLYMWSLAALVVRADSTGWNLLKIAVLGALMFANHQLGAGIAFIGAGCIAVLTPSVPLRVRVALVCAMITGLGMSALWPYHNPFEVLYEVSNDRWNATTNFYSPTALIAQFIPSALGLWGFYVARRSEFVRPLIAAGVVFAILFVSGALVHFPIGHRFSMPLVLVLQTGLAWLILAGCSAEGTPALTASTRWFLLRLMPVLAALGVWGAAKATRNEIAMGDQLGDLPTVVSKLLPEPVSDSGFAGQGIAAWPVVASGRRVLSVPWPEPLVHDLLERQQSNMALFSPDTLRPERLRIAGRWGVHALILDSRIIPPGVIQALRNEGWPERCAGTFMRFDLAPSSTPADTETTSDAACRVANHYIRNPITGY